MSARSGLIFALVAAALVFAPTVGFGFVDWDDGIHLLQNPIVQTPESVPLRDVVLTPGLGYPIPLTVLTYRLEHALVGDTPWLYHLTNVVLHLLACACVFALARRLGLAEVGATVATLVFGLHPAVAETVSWVSGRKDLLVTVLSLATLLVAVRPAAPTLHERALATTTFLLALACKPVAAFVVPTVVALRTLVDRRPLRESLGLVLPMALVLAGYLPLAIAGQRGVNAVVRIDGVAAHARAMWYALGAHLDLLAFLVEPSAKYIPDSLTPPFSPRVDLAPIGFVALASALGAALPRERRRTLAAALLLAGFAYAPNSNLIPLVRFIADTYVYLPLVGIGIALGLGIDALLERLPARRDVYARAIPIVLAVFLAMLALPASARYRDSVALWSQAMRANPRADRVCQNWSEATRTLRGAARGLVAIDHCIARFGPRLFHKNRGLALLELRRYPEALAEFEAALALRPGDAALRALVDEMRAAGIAPAR